MSYSGKGKLTHFGEFASIGEFDLPIVAKQNVSLDEVALLGFSETKPNEKTNNSATVHFFEDDERFDEVWKNPSKYIDRLGQYLQVLSPDFSQFADMPTALQAYNVYRNRWCAAYWQQHGLAVIPTISWSDKRSYRYSFDSIEIGACVAVSTVGCRNNETAFMDGYREMILRIQPTAVLCYGKSFDSMNTLVELIEIEYSPTDGLSHVVDEG
jgi:hypothetical protein